MKFRRSCFEKKFGQERLVCSQRATNVNSLWVGFFPPRWNPSPYLRSLWTEGIHTSTSLCSCLTRPNGNLVDTKRKQSRGGQELSFRQLLCKTNSILTLVKHDRKDTMRHPLTHRKLVQKDVNSCTLRENPASDIFAHICIANQGYKVSQGTTLDTCTV